MVVFRLAAQLPANFWQSGSIHRQRSGAHLELVYWSFQSRARTL